jgi:predicted negative regulator of RcsB-dependent stress response|tara:strand:+ start:2932 stop:3591 length:660 start_codon:yes stop_codon:yes gene_type:complete
MNNNVYENNMKFLPLLKFLEKNKKIIISIFLIVVFIIGYTIVNNQLTKKNNSEASKIYTSFFNEISSENPDYELLEQTLNNLLESYGNSGYAQIALLNKASLDARNNNFEKSLNNFQKLVSITDGRNGNKIYNKIARVSAARILSSEKKYDEALDMIEKFSSESTNGYIHELTGDILLKQNKIDLSLAQYNKALEKYNDETSKSIISMKIANIGKKVDK